MLTATLEQETKPMRRFPDSPPRSLRLPILFFTGIDVALFGLYLVLSFTPVHPNYPDPGAPLQLTRTPAVSGVVVLPAPVQTTHTATVKPWHSAVVYQVPRSTPKPSASRIAVPTTQTPVAVVSTTKPPVTVSPTPSDPSPTDSGD